MSIHPIKSSILIVFQRRVQGEKNEVAYTTQDLCRVEWEYNTNYIEQSNKTKLDILWVIFLRFTPQKLSNIWIDDKQFRQHSLLKKKKKKKILLNTISFSAASIKDPYNNKKHYKQRKLKSPKLHLFYNFTKLGLTHLPISIQDPSKVSSTS